MERNVENLGDPKVPDDRLIRKKQVGRHETTSREARNNRESDQSIVLRDGRADHKGKGLTGYAADKGNLVRT